MTPSRNIGVDCSVFSYPHAGLSSFYRPLLRRLVENLPSHNFLLFSFDDSDVDFLCDLPNTREVLIPPLRPLFMGRGGVIRRTFFDLPSLFLKNQIDIFLSPYYLMTCPLWMRGKVVIAVHDTCFWDLPNLFSSMDRRHHDWALRRNLFLAARIITVSETSKQRILKLFPRLRRKKIDVIYNSWPDDDKGPQVFTVGDRLKKLLCNAPPKLILHAGGWGPVKNCPALLEAFAIASNNQSDIGLVMTGNARYVEAAWRLVDKLNIAHKVILPGVVSSQEMNWLLLERCCGAVSISLYEGFGRMCVEAQRAGLPLVCSDIPTNRELIGEYGIYCSPNDIQDIANALRRLFESPRKTPEFDQRFSIRTNYEKYESIVQDLIHSARGTVRAD